MKPAFNVIGVNHTSYTVTDSLRERIRTLGDPKAFEGCTEQESGHQWFGEPAERNSAQWDDVFADGAVFKHRNMRPRHLCRPGPGLLRRPLRHRSEPGRHRLVSGLPRIMNANVLVEGNLIKRVSTAAIEAPGATVINGGGRTLVPGLIDAHFHIAYSQLSVGELYGGDIAHYTIKAVLGAEKTLMRGFTTIRDMGGAPFSVKKDIGMSRLMAKTRCRAICVRQPSILPAGRPDGEQMERHDTAERA